MPHVTGILSPLTEYAYQYVKPSDMVRARDEGIALHKMVEWSIKGTLDVAALPDWMLPRHAAWQKFLATSGYVPIEAEVIVHNRRLGYAGKLDQRGRLRGVHAVLDVKRTFASPRVIGMQLAAYQAAWNAEHADDEDFEQIHERYGLRFTDKGEFRLVPFANRTDMQDFTIVLAYSRLRERLEMPQ